MNAMLTPNRRLGINYDLCSIDELRDFIKDRTGKEATSNSSQDLVQVLEGLDRMATFRFRDLAAELRLAVYRELLYRGPDHEDEPRSPAIMRVSKEIHKEAADVMYNEQKLRIKATLGPDVATTANIDFPKALSTSLLPVQFIKEGSLLEDVPQGLLVFRHAVVEFTWDPSTPNYPDIHSNDFVLAEYRSRDYIERLMYSIACGISSGGTQTLTMQCNTVAPVYDPHFKKMLKPLRMLDERVDLSFEGLPHDMAWSLVAKRQSGTNGHVDYTKAHAEAVKAVEVVKAAQVPGSKILELNLQAMERTVIGDGEHLKTYAQNLRSFLRTERVQALQARALAKLASESKTPRT